MKSRMMLSIAVATAMLLPISTVSVVTAQDRAHDRDQLKSQQQLQDKDKLQTKDQLKEKEQLKEQERTRERAREHMQTERPEKPQYERAEHGGKGH
jgi:hypothetical protein